MGFVSAPQLCQRLLLSPSLSSYPNPKPFSFASLRCRSQSNPPSSYSSSAAAASSFTWDEAFALQDPASPSYSVEDPSDLLPYFHKVRLCNRGVEKRWEFQPFVVDRGIAGYIHEGFAEHLRKFGDVFLFHREGSSAGRFGNHIELSPSLVSYEDRTDALAYVVKSLESGLIPGIRNELYPVRASFSGPVLLSLERAAAPYFGIKAYGVHMNGYVEKYGQHYLWIGKRSPEKQTYPGLLDHVVAGGLPHGVSCGENLMKECEEEAYIPRNISHRAIPVGAVSYCDIEGYRFKRDVLFCYDLELPQSFEPINQDGEVESFRLVPVSLVSNIIRRTHFFKPNCSLVIMDFLFRHGYIKPEYSGYLNLLASLRSGDCS
ncbi:hypothetical protein MLD38_037104 [Melastoma candidum]|uniref:Uncharacterized protein n=1 Tax=Melastoma candidum TaxID=119954 RepID=A0ACB9LMS4_9MYRT|nr:hypothetical protein MLD38_037104 [Melastoma candidum]